MFTVGLALSLPAVAVSIACAVAYSSSDYFRKAIPGSVSPLLALFYAFGLQTPVLALWLAVSGDVRLSPAYLLPGLADAAIGLAANVLFIIAVRRSPLSLMIPLLALVPVFTAVLGGLMLGEWPTPGQAVGILCVAAGLFTIYIARDPEGRSGFHPVAVWKNLAREPGALPMAGVIVLWSISPPVDKICLAHASVGMHGLVQLVILWGACGIWLLAQGGPKAFVLPRGAAKPLMGVAVTAGLGYGLQLAAYQMTLVAVVELFKRTIGLVGALILGRAYFHEPVTGAKLAGIAIMALGLPLVFLG
jgi:drug/metabolite transporter (DMT)-like permease